jgi:hypothetical protein
MARVLAAAPASSGKTSSVVNRKLQAGPRFRVFHRLARAAAAPTDRSRSRLPGARSAAREDSVQPLESFGGRRARRRDFLSLTRAREYQIELAFTSDDREVGSKLTALRRNGLLAGETDFPAPTGFGEPLLQLFVSSFVFS